LLDDVVAVITNGLSSLPALSIGLGRVEILGKVGLQDILIITNTTSNVVVYNFAEPTKGGTVTFAQGNSESYPRAEQVNEGTTVINFKYDTSAMSDDDELQIFLEETELRVRPYDFGTDALERMRVGLPQAMLDADFEYGLQPTKWQAIAVQRGYPSTYEVSASDISVSSVTTDASTGTGGVGSSLITITTNGAHGLEAGTPITIRALSSSIVGFNRAEGTFLIYDVPATNQIRYYAKAKVGTSSGQVLATTNTQLRQAGFYTGADVGEPTFSVFSNGSSGTFNTTMVVPSGSSLIAYTGAIPPTGAPITTTTGFTSGTQVTGHFGDGSVNSGSVYTHFVKSSIAAGATSIELTDTTDVTANMAVMDDHGDSTAPSQLIISSITDTTLNLNGAITATSYLGDVEDYSSITLTSADYIIGVGTGATFEVDVTSGFYTRVELVDSGSDYQRGDSLRILGSALGGNDGVHDLYISVTATTTSDGEDSTITGAITEFLTTAPGGGNGSGSFTGVASSQIQNTQAQNAQVTITRQGGGYVLASVDAEGSGYAPYNRFLISGTNFDGTSPANDVIVQVTSVGGGSGSGAVTATVLSGTSVRGDTIDIWSTVAISQPTTAELSFGSSVAYSSIATIQVDFATNHGLVPGGNIMTSITTDDGGTNNHILAQGPFFISEVVDLNSIRYVCRSPGTVDTTTDDIQGSVYIRPDAFFTHRPYDGGVQLGTGGPQHGGQAIRQSKKYIRYQSGKGAMYNTGALFAPSFDIRSITAAGTAAGSIITVVCDDQDHSLQSGSTVRVTGVQTTGYDGDYVVNQIVDERTFRLIANTALGSTTAEIGSQCIVSLLYWKGAVVRSGPFDDQNGIFFEYDGEQLAVGRRTSTFQIAGTIAINADSNLVTGTNSRFLDQLQEGDRIVIRGMTHVVSSITNNTTMYVTPDFRGVSNIEGVKASKVQDLIIPQSEWNLDKCDGTGASGYKVDITKMQMIGMQFSWYGAGFIDWMFRGTNGD